MKRMIKGLIATTVVLSMSLTAAAVESPTTGTAVTGVVEGASVDKNGTAVDIVVESVEETLLAEIEYIQETEELKAFLGDLYVEGMEVVEIREVFVDGDLNDVSWPVTIVFEVDGVTANTAVQVLHYYDGAWEVVESVSGAGTITATFGSLSPVAFVIGDTVADSSTDTTTSPQTGETGVIIAVLALAAVAGVVAYSTRKKKANV